MRQLLSRRVAIVRLLASGAALGLGAFATTSRPLLVQAATAPADAPAREPIPVRLAEIVHEGSAFRDGVAEGISVPGQGGAWALTADQPGGVYTSPSFQLEFPCTHVGVHWRTDDLADDAASGPQAGLRVELRSSRDGSRWTSWRRVLVEAHGRDASPGSSAAETFGALVGGRLGSWLQYRLTFGEGWSPETGIERVTLTYLDAGTTPPDRIAAGSPLPPAPSLVATGEGEPAFAKLGPVGFLQRVIPREAWGADESLRFKDGQDQWLRAFVSPKLMVVHHTATDNVYADPAAEVRAIFVYHTVTQGWGDIGYHMLIDNRGQVYEGRLGRADDPDNPGHREIVSRDVVAGHALTYNYGSVGIAMLGNFMDGEPSGPALDTLNDALTFTASRYSLAPTDRVDFLRGATTDIWRDNMNSLSGHRDCVTTECPGDKLYARLPAIRQAVADRIGPAGPRARIARTPADRTLWPTDLVFGWDGLNGAAEYSTRLEGWRPGSLPDTIEPLVGYDPDERPVWGPWTRETAASFALPPDARGHYALLLRARDANGREGAYITRWPMFVDRHVLVDDADPRGLARGGDWRSTSDVLGFNGVGYLEAQPAPADAARPTASLTWTLEVPAAGAYRLLTCWTDGEDRATNAHYVVTGALNEILLDVRVNQQERGGSWVDLGRVQLGGERVCYVTLLNDADGIVVADAVRAVLVESATS
jgi:hypothetical protein